MESSRAQSAEEPGGELVLEALAHLGLDPSEVPPAVLDRLRQRSRHPEHRLIVGRYLLTGELGRGGMGVVYEAWDPGIERKVAIKTIEPDLVPEEEREEVVERFRRETKIVGRLHHPAIVTIYDSGQDRGIDPATGHRLPSVYYYVMEYLEGQPLARVMRERRTFSDVEALTIAASIAEALDLSHQAGIIHRDIKPSNIFLRNNVEAVLLDFGIAKTGSVALTRQGQILGTPSYLAPERLREKEAPIDGRADIFSLGVLLFTMLTGEAPFVGDDVYEVIDKIAKASHPELGRSTPSGQALSRVIDRMLAKSPADRYQSAGAAAAARREILGRLRADARRPDADEGSPEAEPTSPSRPTPVVERRGGALEEDTGRVERAGYEGPAPETELLEGAVRQAPFDLRPTRQERSAGTPPPLNAAAPGAEQATEIAPAHGAVRVADVLGTRPELALMRETRELRQAPDLAEAPSILEVPYEDTSPSMPSLVPSTSGEYQPHRAGEEELTDDETVADSGARVRVPSSLRRAVLRAHGDLRATEPVIRAQRPKDPGKPEARGEVGSGARSRDRAGQAAPGRSPAEGGVAVGPAARSGRPARAERSRIEASLVDEDDVVVKPAPLEALKPDELPTQTGFKLPPGEAPAPEVVRARGDSRVKDPAESAREERLELDLERGSEPPKSAAVARRTFGTAAPRAASKRGSPSIQVRVTGKALDASAEERARVIRRRAIMLITATLASVGIGLVLGRMRQGPRPAQVQIQIPAVSDELAGAEPKVEPRAAQLRRMPGTDEPDLVRPRPPTELLSDAEAARNAGHVKEAARLYDSAARAAPAESGVWARATLGRGDLLRQQGEEAEAARSYRALLEAQPRSTEAAQAKVALENMGLAPKPSRPAPAAARPSSAREAPSAEAAPSPGAPSTPALAADMSAEDKCKAILIAYLNHPQEAVAALEGLQRQHGDAPCVFWNLGKKLEQVGRLEGALNAYRRYLSLEPTSPKRAAVERKITDLEAKLRLR